MSGTEKFAIETRKLEKYYGRSRGIIDIDLQVPRGDFFGFIGPNGAGKSTTIRSLLGLITPTGGEAFILGRECGRSRTDILKKVGYMPSESCFYDGIKVKDMIKLTAGMRGKDCGQRAAQLCDRLCLDVHKRVDELSLGNRKKVSIVCALQHEPELYILDEPTAGLDPLMQQEFFTLLQECNDKGATIFLSSHVLSEIQRYCKNAAIVKEGRIIRKGSVKELAQSNVKRVELTTPSGRESFLYSGEMSKLISQLAQKELMDLTITEPSLDEVVMHYYE